MQQSTKGEPSWTSTDYGDSWLSLCHDVDLKRNNLALSDYLMH